MPHQGPQVPKATDRMQTAARHLRGPKGSDRPLLRSKPRDPSVTEPVATGVLARSTPYPAKTGSRGHLDAGAPRSKLWDRCEFHQHGPRQTRQRSPALHSSSRAPADNHSAQCIGMHHGQPKGNRMLSLDEVVRAMHNSIFSGLNQLVLPVGVYDRI